MPMQSHRQAGPTSQSQTTSSSTSTASSSGRGGRLTSPGGVRSGADPNTFTDGDGNTTTHSPIEAGDAVNPDLSQPDLGAAELEVRLIHDPATPLEVSGCPAEGELFERRASTGVSEDPAWQFVDSQVGSLQAPSRVLQPVEDALYLGGAPQVDDIHQGGLADCYFLASIASIVAQDPGQIQGMISLSGGQASVRFHRFDTSTNTWVPCTVSVSDDLARHTDGSGGLEGLVAAGYRIGHDSQHSSWSASVSGTTLWTNEDAYVEVAAWAPILEKAYATYAQTWGQYGGFAAGSANPSTDAAGNARSGYEMLNGGIAQFSYPIVYGPDCVSFNENAIAYTPGSDVVMTNLPAIQNLLRVSGEGVPAGQSFQLTSMIGRDDAVERLDAQSGAFVSAHGRRYPGFTRHLGGLRDLITAWRAADAAGKQAALEKVGSRAAHIAQPEAFPALNSDREGGDFRDLQELMLIVSNITTDASTGQRSVYAWHSYSVLGSGFVDTDGAAMTLTLANLATQAPRIDAGRSSVQLRNPHGGNEPDAQGTGPQDGSEDGRFSLSLERYFRMFSVQQHGLVRT